MLGSVVEVWRSLFHRPADMPEGEGIDASDGLPPGARALCYVVGPPDSDRATVVSVLRQFSVDVREFARPADVVDGAVGAQPEAMIFGLAVPPEEIVSLVIRLSANGFSGAVQTVDSTDERTRRAVEGALNGSGVRTMAPLLHPVSPLMVEAMVHREGLIRRPDGTPMVDLGAALDSHWVEFYYHPKIDLGRRMLTGAEALARIVHPTHGVLQPGSFLPNATPEALKTLGNHSIKSVLRDWSDFLGEGFNLQLCVNLPIESFDTIPLMNLIKGIVPNSARFPGIIFDVAETELTRAPGAVRTLAGGLRRQKVQIALDRFGHGSSSFDELKTFGFAEFKIDRAMVNGCSYDEKKAEFCRAVVALAHSCGARAVATGVEQIADVDFIAHLGFDMAEGNVFAPPLAKADFIRSLENHRRHEERLRAGSGDLSGPRRALSD